MINSRRPAIRGIVVLLLSALAPCAALVADPGLAAAGDGPSFKTSLTLQAMEPDGAVATGGLTWTVFAPGAGKAVYAGRRADDGAVTVQVKPGDYEVAVTQAGGGLRAQTRFRIGRGETKTLTLTLAPAFEVTLASDPQGSTGSDVAVTWTGPDRSGDWIGVAAPDSGAKSWLVYKYTQDGSPVTLRLPDQPGFYEIRYVLGAPEVVLARLPITVVASTRGRATVEAPASAPAGSPIEVSWKGPNEPGDYISTASEGSADRDYLAWVYTRDGSPVLLTAPGLPGRYEVRYVAGKGDAVLARTTLETTAVAASVTARKAAPAGSTIDVAWTGPGYLADFIAAVSPGAAGGDYRTWTYVQGRQPVRLRLPDQPGSYEIRYVLGGSTVIARTMLQATAVGATLAAPATSPAGAAVSVAWTGPAYDGDYITVTQAGARDTDFLDVVTLRPGATSPVKLRLPDEPGAYEIRYVLGHSHTVIGRAPIRITAPIAR